MPHLRKRSLLMVWISFVLYGLSFSLGASILNVVLEAYGFGLQRKGGEMSLPVRVLVYGAVLLATNLPDFASIIIYLRIRRRLGTAVKPDEDETVEMQQQQEEEDGGASIDSGSTDSSIFPGGPPPQSPPPPPSSSSNNPRRKILRILFLHVSTSLVDLLSLGIPAIPDPALRILILHFFPVTIAFWIPMAVVRASFPQQMGNMASTFCNLVC